MVDIQHLSRIRVFFSLYFRSFSLCRFLAFGLNFCFTVAVLLILVIAAFTCCPPDLGLWLNPRCSDIFFLCATSLSRGRGRVLLFSARRPLMHGARGINLDSFRVTLWPMVWLSTFYPSELRFVPYLDLWSLWSTTLVKSRSSRGEETLANYFKIRTFIFMFGRRRRTARYGTSPRIRAQTVPAATEQGRGHASPDFRPLSRGRSLGSILLWSTLTISTFEDTPCRSTLQRSTLICRPNPRT
jgi:hypothetical protein